MVDISTICFHTFLNPEFLDIRFHRTGMRAFTTIESRNNCCFVINNLLFLSKAFETCGSIEEFLLVFLELVRHALIIFVNMCYFFIFIKMKIRLKFL